MSKTHCENTKHRPLYYYRGDILYCEECHKPVLLVEIYYWVLEELEELREAQK